MLCRRGNRCRPYGPGAGNNSRPEVFPDHFLQSPVCCQRTLYNLSLCLPAEYPPLVIQLRKGEKPVMTVIVLILVLFFFLLHKPIIPAHRNTAVHCFKPIFFLLLKAARMGEEHLCRITIPHFQRMEIDPVTPIHIQEKLGGIPDARNRLERMSAPQQREICHRIQLEQIRACHAEKVAHHQICVPYGYNLKVRPFPAARFLSCQMRPSYLIPPLPQSKSEDTFP